MKIKKILYSLLAAGFLLILLSPMILFNVEIQEEITQISEQRNGDPVMDLKVTGQERMSLPNIPQSVYSGKITQLTHIDEGYLPVIILGTSTVYILVLSDIQFRINSSQKDKSSRGQIYYCIWANPGIHFGGICQSLEIQNGVAQHHLYTLENNNKIFSTEDGQYRRYFPNHIHYRNEEKQKILGFLHRGNMGKIIKHLYSTSQLESRQKLAEKIGVTCQSISYNCNILEKQDIIEKHYIKCKVYYRLTEQLSDTLDQLKHIEII